MTGHEYLDNLLSQRSVDQQTLQLMRGTREEIEGYLRRTVGQAPRFYYAGSYGKDTMLDVYHDLDIVVYYPASTSKTLKEIYWEVYNVLSKQYLVQQKDVAIRLPYESGFVVDIVPGRAFDDSYRYANLFRSETESWLQTSIKVHIETVQASNLRGAMRLMKLWNVRHNLGLRSFFLEILVARVLSGTASDGYDGQIRAVLTYLRDNILTVRIVDPANTNNVISDLISVEQKRDVASQAALSLNQQYWSQILW